MSAAKSWCHLLQICAVKCGLLHHHQPSARDEMCCHVPLPYPPLNREISHVTHPFSHRTKVANSNNDSFGIHSVKVLVQVHYLGALDEEIISFLKVGAHRVPTSPKGIRGPEGARIKENSRSGTERICVHLHGYMPAPKGQ